MRSELTHEQKIRMSWETIQKIWYNLKRRDNMITAILQKELSATGQQMVVFSIQPRDIDWLIVELKDAKRDGWGWYMSNIKLEEMNDDETGPKSDS